jgi:16S rRNA (cytosine1402-N4)-methyltransferase
MRLDASPDQTAADILNTLPEADLANLLFLYGEERYSRRIARAISRERSVSPLRTTTQLASLIQKAVPSVYRHGRIHPATRTFQALRIAVNRELDVLEGALQDAIDALELGGRLCVISFHSLEDRIVKRVFRARAGMSESGVSILTKRPEIPSEGERQANPRARSAKMRVLERISTMTKGCVV